MNRHSIWVLGSIVPGLMACGGPKQASDCAAPTAPGCSSGGSDTLVVLAEGGVSVAPASGQTVYSTGSTVRYTVSLLPGYQQPSVTLDGAAVQPNGVIAMNGNHVLVAGADTILTVAPADQSIVQDALALLAAPTSVTAYQKFTNDIDQLYATYGPAVATPRLAAIDAAAFRSPSDTPAIRQILATNAGMTYGSAAAASATRSLLRLLPARSALRRGVVGVRGGESAPPKPKTVFFINGMLNSVSDPEAAKAILLAMGPSIGLTVGDTVYTFVNPSWIVGVGGTYFTCLLGDVNVTTAAFPASCGSFDLAVIPQYLNAIFGANATESAVSTAFAQAIRGELAQDRSVVVVAHSQGNLITQSALNTLSSQLPASAYRCLGIVSVAPPTTTGWYDSFYPHTNILVQGKPSQDILLDFLYPSGPPSNSLPVASTVQLVDTVFTPLEQVVDTATVAWTSRNAAVATVSASGLVASQGNGATWIVASYAGGGADSSAVTVQSMPIVGSWQLTATACGPLPNAFQDCGDPAAIITGGSFSLGGDGSWSIAYTYQEAGEGTFTLSGTVGGAVAAPSAVPTDGCVQLGGDYVLNYKGAPWAGAVVYQDGSALHVVVVPAPPYGPPIAATCSGLGDPYGAYVFGAATDTSQAAQSSASPRLRPK